MVICLCATTAKSAPCSKHVLILDGSPHTDGPTAWLIDTASRLLEGRAEVTRLRCFDQPVQPCDDCRACYRIRGCSKRDLDDFYVWLERADAVIFACPVYNASFPAPMKAVLDRLQRYWSARFIQHVRPPIERPKKAALLTTGGSDDPWGALPLETQLRPLLTVINTRLLGAAHICATDKQWDPKPYAQRVEALVDGLLEEPES